MSITLALQLKGACRRALAQPALMAPNRRPKVEGSLRDMTSARLYLVARLWPVLTSFRYLGQPLSPGFPEGFPRTYDAHTLDFQPLLLPGLPSGF